MPRSDRLISLALQGPSTAIRFSPVRTRDLINLMLSDDEFPCGQFGDLMADRTGLYASDFYFARGRVRCFFVAGFVRIRCDSVEGIRILTNPATLNTHHSQYQCHSISPTARTGPDRTGQDRTGQDRTGQDRSKPYRVSRCRIDPSGSAAECVSH